MDTASGQGGRPALESGKVTLVVPTLNEILGMKTIMPRIPQGCCDQVLILDGGSTDGTVEYAKEHGYTVVRQTKNGFRRAYAEILPFVTGDIIVTFSPDGNSEPELVANVVDTIRKGYDMVIVSRYLDGARSYDDNRFTSLANMVFTRLIGTVFGFPYTDAMVIFRAYKKRLVKDLELANEANCAYYAPERLFRKVGSWEPLLSMRAAKKKLKIAEIPGDEPPRLDGIKRMHYSWGFEFLMQVFIEAFAWR